MGWGGGGGGSGGGGVPFREVTLLIYLKNGEGKGGKRRGGDRERCVSKMGVKISFAVRTGGVTVWLSQKPKWRKTLN